MGGPQWLESRKGAVGFYYSLTRAAIGHVVPSCSDRKKGRFAFIMLCRGQQ